MVSGGIDRELSEEDLGSSNENVGSSKHFRFVSVDLTGSILLSFLSFPIPLTAASDVPFILALELVTYPELSEFCEASDAFAGTGAAPSAGDADAGLVPVTAPFPATGQKLNKRSANNHLSEISIKHYEKKTNKYYNVGCKKYKYIRLRVGSLEGNTNSQNSIADRQI